MVQYRGEQAGSASALRVTFLSEQHHFHRMSSVVYGPNRADKILAVLPDNEKDAMRTREIANATGLRDNYIYDALVIMRRHKLVRSKKEGRFHKFWKIS